MIKRLFTLAKKLFSSDAPAKIARRLRIMSIASSVARVNLLFNSFSYQLRLSSLPYGKQHTAIVIGAGGGIGAAVCLKLLQKSSKVFGTYRDTIPQLPLGVRCQLFKMDILSIEQLTDVYETLNRLEIRADLILIATGFNSGKKLSRVAC